ncbi:hypothetical protein AABB24_028136 [Solanum stoloniferum]|uniref:Uncharacterized protein n=1 Tax=Solanum stoloniferum TaxID=62892 RepID=A0ABD2S5G3_9SOLN
MVQWTKHNAKRFHQSLFYAHMIRDAQVWLKIIMNCLIPGLHYTNITRDRVCLVYALMTPTKLNIGDVLQSPKRKARFINGAGTNLEVSFLDFVVLQVYQRRAWTIWHHCSQCR